MLRGPYLFPTATNQYLVAEGYLPPGEPGVDYDPQRLPDGLRSKATRISVAQTLRLLQEKFPEQRVNEFGADDLIRFLTEGADPRTGRRWAPHTKKLRRSTLRTFFEWAVDAGLVAVDPTTTLRRRVRVTNNDVKNHTWLTGAEVQALLATCDDGTVGGLRDRILLELLVNTGLRASEACALKWRQVNLFARTISLGTETKGSKPAVVPILVDSLADALQAWKGRYEVAVGGDVRLLPVLVKAQSTTWGGAFIDWGNPLHYGGLYDIVRRRGQRAGAEALAPHDLRRTFAGLLENQGTQVQDISRLLRHSNVAVTQRYLEDNPGRYETQRISSLY